MTDTPIALSGQEPQPEGVSHVTFVGGPRDGQIDVLGPQLPPPSISVDDANEQGSRGSYQRSVRCADDGALRYIWREA